MPTSRTSPTEDFGERGLALAWGLWIELGVSSWTARTHADWAIDPEPLILFTAGLGDLDPRLRDEATDWCIRNWRYISKARLKTLLGKETAEVAEAFGEFAATVNHHAGVRWPGATTQRPFRVTGRSQQPDLDLASVCWLRLRAMFGLGARAEILRYFLGQHAGTTARIALAASYSKRNIADECEGLVRAGVLRRPGNSQVLVMRRREELGAFVGDMASIQPDWSALFHVAAALRRLGAHQDKARGVFAVEVKRAIEVLVDDFAALDIEPPGRSVTGVDLWPAVERIGMQTLGEWAVGRWHEADATTTQER